MSARTIPARDYYTPELLDKLGRCASTAAAFNGTSPEAIAHALREAGIGIVDLDRSRHLIDERVYESALLRARAAEDRTFLWRSMDTAPTDGTRIWGKVGDDAIAMLWHPTFDAFVSSWNRMTMHNGWSFEDGTRERDHSPVIHHPTAWSSMPEAAT